MDAVTLYSTWPDAPGAEACAAALIEARAAACATVIPGAVSTYRWAGAIEKSAEVVLLVKTAGASAARAREIVITNHPYEVPCVLGYGVDPRLSHPAYLTWLSQEIDG